jgi:hypothetical protein
LRLKSAGKLTNFGSKNRLKGQSLGGMSYVNVLLTRRVQEIDVYFSTSKRSSVLQIDRLRRRVVRILSCVTKRMFPMIQRIGSSGKEPF